MIWPFRPYPPLSLTHKVQLERHFRSIAAVIAEFPKDVSDVICPQDIDPVLKQVSEENLPQVLFQFFAGRIPSNAGSSVPEPTMEWAAISLLGGDGQTQPLQKHTDDQGRISKIQFDPELKKSPYQIASLTALACAECWFQSLSEPQKTSLANVPVDLLPVFFGITPVLANAVLHTHDGGTGTARQFESSQMGMLNALEHGYLMALAEHSLGIDYSGVTPLLRPDAGKSFKAGLKFLQKTNDTILPQDLRSHSNALLKPPTEDELSSRNETIVLSALMDLSISKTCPEQLTSTVCRLLGHSEPEIRKWAASTLRYVAQLSDEQLNDVYAALGDNSVPVRTQAILALRPGFERDDDVVDRLADFLVRPERVIVEASVVKLQEYSNFPDRMPELLLKAIHTLAVKGASDEVFSIAIQLLSHFTEDPEGLVKERFADDPTIYSTLFAESDPPEDQFEPDAAE